MKRFFLLLILTMSIFATNWKGGNTGYYWGDTTCVSQYLLHRLGTTFPSDSIEDCCPDTITRYSVFAHFCITDTSYFLPESTCFFFPVVYDSTLDTIFLSGVGIQDTIVITSFDTVWSLAWGRIRETKFSKYLCDTLISWIDTTATPPDSLTCAFCDSIMLATLWFFNGEDSSSIEVVQDIKPDARDRCNIMESGGYSPGVIAIDIYHIDNNYTTRNFTTIEQYNITNFASYSISNYDSMDIARLITSISQQRGIWVKDCDCTDTITSTIGFDALFCIDSSWSVWFTSKAYDRVGGLNASSESEAMYFSPLFAEQLASRAAVVEYVGHNTHASAQIDTLKDLFGAESLWTIDGFKPARKAFYCAFDSTKDYAVWTRDIGDSLSCSYYDYEYQVPYEDYFAKSLRFDKWIDFTKVKNDKLFLYNFSQPNWVIVPLVDDYVSWIAINGEYFTLDGVSDRYTKRYYTINPTRIIDYSNPVHIEIGVHSTPYPFLGAQVVFGIVSPDTFTCYTLRDSITLPDCNSGNSCNDTICFFFPQGFNAWNAGTPNISYVGNQTVCLSVCDMDTLDMSGFSYGVYQFLPYMRIITTDSTDTFTIKQFADSTTFNRSDSGPSIFNTDVNMKKNVLEFNDNSQTDTTKLFMTADTFHITTDDSTIIVKIGSGSVFISDKAIWFSGCTVNPLKYSLALGNGCKATGNYSTSFGYHDSSTGDYSMSWGGENWAYGDHSTAHGILNKASGTISTVWGQECQAIGSLSTAWGNQCIADFNATVWGNHNKAFGELSTIAGGQYCRIDSVADYSFLIGLNDTLSSDSTFRSAYPYNEFNGNVYIQNGKTLFGMDTTQADTFWVYDDGDSTRFDSNNPIKIGHSSLIVQTDGDVKVHGNITADTLKGNGSQLTGISAGGLGYVLPVSQTIFAHNPTDNGYFYFGADINPEEEGSAGGSARIYIPKDGTIKTCDIFAWANDEQGSNEAWIMKLRRNNTTDFEIDTISTAALYRHWTKTGLSISVVTGDYIEIKSKTPTWETNPLSVRYSGYIYIE